MAATLLATRRIYPCGTVTNSVCVALKHGLVVVADTNAKCLQLYSLVRGLLLRSVEPGSAMCAPQRSFPNCLCISSEGDSVLISDYWYSSVREVRIEDGAWVRYVGEGMLIRPQYVDCNSEVIAVCGSMVNHSISVLSWADGSVRAQFGTYGTGAGQLQRPKCCRLFPDGSGLIVADNVRRELCVFQTNGQFVHTVGGETQGFSSPCDVAVCATDGSLIVANSYGTHKLVMVGVDGITAVCCQLDADYAATDFVSIALAALPAGGCLASIPGDGCLHLVDYRSRLAWMSACVRVQKGT